VTRVSSPAELADLSDDTYVTIAAPLEKQYLVVRTRGGDSFTLNPVEGYENRLVVGRFDVSTDDDSADASDVHEGRLVSRGWLGYWTHRGSRIDMIAEFEPHGVAIPADARMLVEGDRPAVSALTVSLLCVGAIGLLVFATRLIRGVYYLANRAALAARLASATPHP